MGEEATSKSSGSALFLQGRLDVSVTWEGAPFQHSGPLTPDLFVGYGALATLSLGEIPSTEAAFKRLRRRPTPFFARAFRENSMNMRRTLPVVGVSVPLACAGQVSNPLGSAARAARHGWYRSGLTDVSPWANAVQYRQPPTTRIVRSPAVL
jgi:hypothetical protein